MVRVALFLVLLLVASRLDAVQVRADTGQSRSTEADVRFMQRMIAHHTQALKMASLVPTHTSRQDMRLLARRIDVSQRDEIDAMRRWLGKRGKQVPDSSTAHSHHAAVGDTPMPGMLSESDLAQLEKTTGAEFDRLFLQLMIRHHEGALTMVAELFATRGAAQEPELFGFASEIDSDQRAEISRMRALLETLPAGAN
jgi:uncharacterized protein (DUF305 family)